MGITTTWKPSPYFSANYGDSTNWYAGVSGLSDTAEFEASSVTNISVTDDERAGQWLFNPGATQYNFDIADRGSMAFDGIGITVDFGSVHVFDFSNLLHTARTLRSRAMGTAAPTFSCMPRAPMRLGRRRPSRDIPSSRSHDQRQSTTLPS